MFGSLECLIINWVPVKSKSYTADSKLYERIDIFKNIELRILQKKQNKLIHVQYTMEKNCFYANPSYISTVHIVQTAGLPILREPFVFSYIFTLAYLKVVTI